MDPRAYRVAQEFVRAHLRKAKYAPEFLQWTGQRKFRNPETGNEVKFLSLPDAEQRRIYDQWARKTRQAPEGGRGRAQRSEGDVERRNADIARNGTIVASEVLSEGGTSTESGPKKKGVNQSYIVKMRDGDQEQVYIRKPAEGEEKHLRLGIPAGTYHAREQAGYDLDRLLGGEGVVPTTITRGSDDGSYQVWVEGARAMHGEDLDDLVRKVKPEDLQRSPDFQRVNVLDAILGHQDRHRGNLLYHFEGEETPENLRFVAIDNGLSLASPGEHPGWISYDHPFGAFYIDDESATPDERQNAMMEAWDQGDRQVAKSLTSLSPEMQESLRKVDLGDAARAITAAGVDEEGAVRAALTRIAAFQADPDVFAMMLKRQGGDLDAAWQDFQHASGTDELLRLVGAQDKADDIRKAVEAAKPKRGWADPQHLDNYFRESEAAMQDLDAWGETKPAAAQPSDAGTRRTGPKPPEPQYDSWGFARQAVTVRDRWLRTAVRRTASSRGKPSRGRP